MSQSTLPSKHGKYSTPNPISRRLVRNFMRTLEELIAPLGAASVLDVGCGEGMVLSHLERHLRTARCAAIDVDPVEVADAARNLPWCDVRVGSAYEVPFGPGEFDLVICSEVLEHLEHPDRALAELCRVSAKHVLVSVPREPLWRALNIARGAYLTGLGNTPDHLNHWSAGAFERWVGRLLRVETRRNPVPWTVVLAAKAEQSGREAPDARTATATAARAG